MTESSNQSSTVVDPLGEFGPDQKKAFVWLVVVVVIAVCMVGGFCRFDRSFYTSNAKQFDLDYETTRTARLAATSLLSDNATVVKDGEAHAVDHRAAGDLHSIKLLLKKSSAASGDLPSAPGEGE